MPADDEPGPSVVVISHQMWQREFGGRCRHGQPLTLRGLRYTVVGVAPSSFRGVVPLLTPELWVPMGQAGVEPVGISNVVPGPGRTRLERRGMRWLFVKGRPSPG